MDDLAPLYARRRNAVSMRQGVVVAWDQGEGTNAVRVGGAVLEDLPHPSNLNLNPGDVISLQRYHSTFFVLGRIAHVKGGGTEGAVVSVNGQTGVVTLDAHDVGALPDTYQGAVTSVNGQGGDVVLSAADVNAVSTTLEKGWTDLPLQGYAADGGKGQSLHRVRRHATGQVEIQFDVDMSANENDSNTVVTTLPAWATPGRLLRYPAGVTATASTSPGITINSDSTVHFSVAEADRPTPWLALNVTYTP